MLTVADISCGYNEKPVIEGLSFHLQKGCIGALLGPSGCGKTTLLKVIAGFHSLRSGQIVLRGVSVAKAYSGLVPEKRKIGVVFQDYALFPHLTVAKNIGFGLHHLKHRPAKEKIDELLDLTTLTALQHAYPHELSGGQQQRVALARALAPEPDLLLMDEPFSNLDAEMRGQLTQDVQRILRSKHTTALLVTHDQLEAFTMADQIGLLQDGQLQQWDTPYRLYHEPATRFVAGFIGKGVFIRGRMLSASTAITALGVIAGKTSTRIAAGTNVDVLIRPDDITFCTNSALQARVSEKVFAGSTMLYRLRLNDSTLLEVITPSHNNYAIDEVVGVKLSAEHLIAFPC
jgi:iron(III) transport system ATP-binding protein